ncbi:MAG: ATP synthase F1 subunit gamma [Planctomycetes bacterium]|nr:ATP synthase F1 subunit gamma [Planctomycetota bacterium]
MASVKELRLRIKSVGSIKQITRAMEMVATTKLRRFQDRAIASRPYAEEISTLVGNLAAVLGEDLDDQPLFRPGKGERTALLLVSSDRGLCGPYNSNLFRELESALRRTDDTSKIDFFVYGRKGYQYLTGSGRKIERFFVDPQLEKIDYRGAARVAVVLREAFEAGTYSNVRVLFTAFESMARFVPTWIDFLPIEPSSLGGDGDATEAGGSLASGDVILEPDAATIFARLVPRYLETRIYNALIEALTSEYASRRMSMKNATEAAGDMQSELKKIYNRKRQEGITKDLLDIVGGAEALR